MSLSPQDLLVHLSRVTVYIGTGHGTHHTQTHSPTSLRAVEAARRASLLRRCQPTETTVRRKAAPAGPTTAPLSLADVS